jgi:peptidoglycan/xylan/chitin deacetylase (PgdA/CDA1 family)
MTEYSRFLSEDGYAIFLFHGVIRKNTHPIRNYTRKHITGDRFRDVLSDLAARGAPVSMPDIASAQAGGPDLPLRAFAVTFDDGFRNNFSIAAPVLEEMGIPATFYITTNFIDKDSPSWIDRIEDAVERRESFSVRLPSCGIDGSYGTREERVRLLDSIRECVKTRRDLDPYRFAEDFCNALGVPEFTPDPDLDRKMTWDEVRELSGEPLFTIGGHGHTHRILEYLSEEDLENEIGTCLGNLEDRIGEPVRHFSYPEGQAFCYSDRVISMLRKSGIVCSPTAEPGVNHPGESLFRLKRITVV